MLSIRDSRIVKTLSVRVRWWLEVLSVFREGNRDLRRYAKHMAPPDRLSGWRSGVGRGLETQITKDYHRVEKGLALADPRPSFGSDVSSRLGVLLPIAQESGYGTRDFVAHGESARDALHDWNTQGLRAESVAPVWLEDDEATDDPMTQVFLRRRSVRAFDRTRKVDVAVVERAVELAVMTPSVCNRQIWRVHLFGGPRVQEMLGYQNGNRGFTTSVPLVAIVTADSRLMAGADERNQSWIEAGLFSMSFVYALTALGLSSCMLNMSAPNVRLSALRDAANIGAGEEIAMMVAIGYASPGYRVARSPRRAPSDVLIRDASTETPD